MSQILKLSNVSICLFLGLSLGLPVIAQETDEDTQLTREERIAQRQERKAEFLENHPDAAARLEERKANREAHRAEFLENNPDAAARLEERKANRQARFAELEANNPERAAALKERRSNRQARQSRPNQRGGSNRSNGRRSGSGRR